MIDWNKVGFYDCQHDIDEAIAASAIKTYLSDLPEDVALRNMQKTFKPRVLCLPMDGEPLKIVNADVDAPMLKQFIENALDWGARSLQADAEMERGLKIQLVARLKKVSAARVVQNISVYLLDYLADCYCALKESSTWP